jgi:hypothetical protein
MCPKNRSICTDLKREREREAKLSEPYSCPTAADNCWARQDGHKKSSHEEEEDGWYRHSIKREIE